MASDSEARGDRGVSGVAEYGNHGLWDENPLA
jgi:hypothetical protein